MNEVGIKNAEVEQEEIRGATRIKFKLRVTTAPLVILGKRMVAIYIEDITEQRRMETAILMANKKLNLLGTVTRHDVVNQLSVLIGNLEIASLKDPKSPFIKPRSRRWSSPRQWNRERTSPPFFLSPRTTN